MTRTPEIDAYLKRLEAELSAVPSRDRRRLIEDVHAQLDEAIDEGGAKTPDGVASLLTRTGEPRRLARELRARLEDSGDLDPLMGTWGQRKRGAVAVFMASAAFLHLEPAISFFGSAMFHPAPFLVYRLVLGGVAGVIGLAALALALLTTLRPNRTVYVLDVLALGWGLFTGIGPGTITILRAAYGNWPWSVAVLIALGKTGVTLGLLVWMLLPLLTRWRVVRAFGAGDVTG